ncbi:adenine phosphoribosyltransferase [Pontiellaceae bacterium B12219]|nr:adenine phosphoribosyltransferase [Pontiellaceae bacterium B12219]
MQHIHDAIRNISDFPKPGIQFKDITPLLADPAVFKQTIDCFADRHRTNRIDVVVGIEARGFVFSSALAYALGAGTGMVRKPGKLPYKTYRKTYELEYGTDTVEIHQDAFLPGQRILIIDDVLATGGTVAATTALIEENFDVEIVEIDFLMELGFLQGREMLGDRPVFSLLSY